MSKSMRISAIFTALILIAAAFCGCGYKIGNLGHPQLKSVAVAPVVNDTLAYNAAANLRGLLNETFQTDGTLKLTGMNKADCIVYARITSVGFSEISWGSRDNANGTNSFTPNQWLVKLAVEYSVIIPGRALPLLQAQQVTATAEFMSGPDIEISRNYAIKQACFVAAKKIVSEITEAW